MRLRRGKTNDRGRRGVAAVEFAIFAPVFAVLITGTVAASKALQATSVMSQALREGARLAAMDWTGVPTNGTTPNDKVVQDIKNFLTASGVDAKQVQVTITFADGPKQGQNFVLGDPANYLQLFEIKATQAHSDANFWCSYLTEGKGLSAKVVFRAGRSTSQ
jgi:Flp pilus assembly protein TadG